MTGEQFAATMPAMAVHRPGTVLRIRLEKHMLVALASGAHLCQSVELLHRPLDGEMAAL